VLQNNAETLLVTIIISIIIITIYLFNSKHEHLATHKSRTARSDLNAHSSVTAALKAYKDITSLITKKTIEFTCGLGLQARKKFN